MSFHDAHLSCCIKSWSNKNWRREYVWVSSYTVLILLSMTMAVSVFLHWTHLVPFPTYGEHYDGVTSSSANNSIKPPYHVKPVIVLLFHLMKLTICLYSLITWPFSQLEQKTRTWNSGELEPQAWVHVTRPAMHWWCLIHTAHRFLLL